MNFTDFSELKMDLQNLRWYSPNLMNCEYLCTQMCVYQPPTFCYTHMIPDVHKCDLTFHCTFIPYWTQPYNDFIQTVAFPIKLKKANQLSKCIFTLCCWHSVFKLAQSFCPVLVLVCCPGKHLFVAVHSLLSFKDNISCVKYQLFSQLCSSWRSIWLWYWRHIFALWNWSKKQI